MQGSVQNKKRIILFLILLVFSFPPKIYAEDKPILPSGDIIVELNSSNDLVNSEETFDSKIVISESRNSANIKNNISAHSSTGGNKVIESTDGDVVIQTGDSKATVDVINYVNSSIYFENTNTDSLVSTQSNIVEVVNTLSMVSETGANIVTGNSIGQVEIKSGSTKTSVSLFNAINKSVSVKSCDPSLIDKPSTPKPQIDSPVAVVSETKVSSYTSTPDNNSAGRGGYVLPFTGGKHFGLNTQNSNEYSIYAYMISFVSGYWLAQLLSLRLFKK